MGTNKGAAFETQSTSNVGCYYKGKVRGHGGLATLDVCTGMVKCSHLTYLETFLKTTTTTTSRMDEARFLSIMAWHGPRSTG